MATQPRRPTASGGAPWTAAARAAPQSTEVCAVSRIVGRDSSDSFIHRTQASRTIVAPAGACIRAYSTRDAYGTPLTRVPQLGGTPLVRYCEGSAPACCLTQRHARALSHRQNARQVYLGGFDAEEQAALACACTCAGCFCSPF